MLYSKEIQLKEKINKSSPFELNDLNQSFSIDDADPRIEENGGFVKREDRELTDFWAIFLFIPFVLIFFYIGFDGYQNGRTILLTTPYDGAGNFCGVGKFKGYEYLVFEFIDLEGVSWAPPSPKMVFKNTVCAKKCPESIEEGEDYKTQVECITNEFVGECPNKKYLSAPMMKICVPKTGKDVPEALDYYKDMIKKITIFGQIIGLIGDLESCWYMILISIFLSSGICYIYLELMCVIAEAISWICIIIVQMSLIAASIVSWYFRYWLAD